MNIQELTTWQKLLDLEFDGPDAALPFSARLSRDNDWPLRFAERAIEEYRKFCFLAAYAEHPVTPSEEVDQVWHLHVLYSRHYWDALCRDTLDLQLHHGPTEGGAEEDRKYRVWYDATLDSYRRYFGEPPADLWPDANERFDVRNDFVRVNRRDVVTFDRVPLRRGALAVLLGGGVLAVAHALAQADGGAAPASTFAIWPIVAVVAVGVLVASAARGKRAVARKRGKRGKRTNHDNAAVAAGGGVASGPNCPDGSTAGAGGDCGGASGCGSSGCGGGGCGGGGS
jgi:hypothetical protein